MFFSRDTIPYQKIGNNSLNSKKPTAGIILAGGASVRFGRPKQLAGLKDKPLLEWVIDACLNSRLDRIVLVLGQNAQGIIQILAEKVKSPRIRTVINRQHHAGMSGSLRRGLLEASAFPSAMFLLGDQPLIDSKLIDSLLDHFWKSEKKICAPVFQGKRGNPVIFDNIFYNDLLALKGDIGARNILHANPDQVLAVEVDDPLYFFDIDTENDLKDLNSRLAKP